MPALKYWDGSAWRTLVGGNAPPAYKPAVFQVNDQYGTDTAISATSYGVSTGPTYTITMPAFSIVMVWFYAKVTLGDAGAALPGKTSDLFATPSASGASSRGPFDSDAFYVASQPNTGVGPGFVSGVLPILTNIAGATTFTMNYRVTVGVTQVRNRRMVLMPNFLIPA